MVLIVVDHITEHARAFYGGGTQGRPPCLKKEALLDIVDELMIAKDFVASIGDEELAGSLKRAVALCRRAIGRAAREMKEVCE